MSYIKKVPKKKQRLGLHWRNNWINFCSVCFTGDSFIFSSNFHNDQSELQMGDAVTVEEGFKLSQPLEIHSVAGGGCHLTLHKPTEEKPGVIHFRENDRGKIVDSRPIDWFPVTKPFHLLTLYSPPLPSCPSSSRSTDFFSPVDEGYENSIQVTVDIFPRNTTEHYPSVKSLWIYWGYSPDYLVRTSFNLLDQKTEALLLWPKGLFSPKGEVNASAK